MISSAHGVAGATAEARQQAMLSSNPRVVLRNWVAEEAIKAAEKGDYAAVGPASMHPC
jgi:uncharacterized protein YdiU (UPF0061 family)